MSTALTVLVTGSTGLQGGAVINALLASPYPPNILALTRSLTSAKATALTAKSPSHIRLVQGDLDHPATLAEIITYHKPTTVFSVQTNSFGSTAKHLIEETQAKALIDAAFAPSSSITHFVQSTNDRGGPTRSDADATHVPHFRTKYNIEKYLIAACQRKQSVTYTILRPVTFFENLTPDIHGKTFAAMWHCLPSAHPLQLISVRDIGLIAARAILSPQDSRFHKVALSIAADELTQPQADGVWRKVFDGRAMPRTPAVVGTGVKWVIPELGAMFKWFAGQGYGADVKWTREVEPGCWDLEGWLRGREGSWLE